MTEEQRLAAIKEIDEQCRKQADGLEIVAAEMKAHCEVLRGERQDLTGVGEWNIIIGHLEHIMGVKVITQEQL